jgi:hypothetical protein
MELSSSGRAKMLTEVQEPYGEPGMLGLFATTFRVKWQGENYTEHRHFDEAKKAIADNVHAHAEQIDRIETIWVRG